MYRGSLVGAGLLCRRNAAIDADGLAGELCAGGKGQLLRELEDREVIVATLEARRAALVDQSKDQA